MPNTKVVRRDVQVGTLGASMGSTQTSMNLGAVPSFPTLASSNGDYIPITLLNTGSIPLSEIVYLSSYASGDSTGGIVRGQETAQGAGGSTTWAQANTWIHAPTAVDIVGPNAWQIAGNTSGTTASLSVGSVTLAGGNSITLSQNANAITISGANVSQSLGASNLGNTQGTSGVASGPSVQLAFAATNWLSISQSVNGASATITLTPGGYLGRFQHNTAALYSSSTSNVVNTSISFARMDIPHYLSFTRVEVPVVISLGTSATTNTGGNRQSWVYGIYTRNASTLTPIVGGSSSASMTWASNSGVYSSLTGQRLLSFALASAITPGEYYFGLQVSTSTWSDTNAAGGSTTNLSATIAPVHATSLTATAWQNYSALTGASINPLFPMQGVGSVSISNTTQTYQASDITMTGVSGQQANIIAILRSV